MVRVANTYDCHIEIKNKGKVASAKSLLGLLALAASTGSELEIEAEGKGADEAIEAIRGLARERFGESE